MACICNSDCFKGLLDHWFMVDTHCALAFEGVYQRDRVYDMKYWQFIKGVLAIPGRKGRAVLSRGDIEITRFCHGPAEGNRAVDQSCDINEYIAPGKSQWPTQPCASYIVALVFTDPLKWIGLGKVLIVGTYHWCQKHLLPSFDLPHPLLWPPVQPTIPLFCPVRIFTRPIPPPLLACPSLWIFGCPRCTRSFSSLPTNTLASCTISDCFMTSTKQLSLAWHTFSEIGPWNYLDLFP